MEAVSTGDRQPQADHHRAVHTHAAEDVSDTSPPLGRAVTCVEAGSGSK